MDGDCNDTDFCNTTFHEEGSGNSQWNYLAVIYILTMSSAVIGTCANGRALWLVLRKHQVRHLYVLTIKMVTASTVTCCITAFVDGAVMLLYLTEEQTFILCSLIQIFLSMAKECMFTCTLFIAFNRLRKISLGITYIRPVSQKWIIFSFSWLLVFPLEIVQVMVDQNDHSKSSLLARFCSKTSMSQITELHPFTTFMMTFEYTVYLLVLVFTFFMYVKGVVITNRRMHLIAPTNDPNMSRLDATSSNSHYNKPNTDNTTSTKVENFNSKRTENHCQELYHPMTSEQYKLDSDFESFFRNSSLPTDTPSLPNSFTSIRRCKSLSSLQSTNIIMHQWASHSRSFKPTDDLGLFTTNSIGTLNTSPQYLQHNTARSLAYQSASYIPAVPMVTLNVKMLPTNTRSERHKLPPLHHTEESALSISNLDKKSAKEEKKCDVEDLNKSAPGSSTNTLPSISFNFKDKIRNLSRSNNTRKRKSWHTLSPTVSYNTSGDDVSIISQCDARSPTGGCKHRMENNKSKYAISDEDIISSDDILMAEQDPALSCTGRTLTPQLKDSSENCPYPEASYSSFKNRNLASFADSPKIKIARPSLPKSTNAGLQYAKNQPNAKKTSLCITEADNCLSVTGLPRSSRSNTLSHITRMTSTPKIMFWRSMIIMGVFTISFLPLYCLQVFIVFDFLSTESIMILYPLFHCLQYTYFSLCSLIYVFTNKKLMTLIRRHTAT